MMAVVASYKALDKSNWGRQDRMAFRLLSLYRGDEQPTPSAAARPSTARASAMLSSVAASFSSVLAVAGGSLSGSEEEKAARGGGDDAAGLGGASARKRAARAPTAASSPSTWAMLELAQTMTVGMRCTWWQTDAQSAQFVSMLQGLGPDGDGSAAEEPPLTTDEQAQRWTILAQLYTHRSRRSPDKARDGLECCMHGLALEASLGASAQQFGLAPMLHCLAAQLHAKLGDPHKAEAELQLVKAFDGTGYMVQQAVTFKASRLRRSLGLMVAEDYERITLAGGKRAVLAVRLTGGAGTIANWDWALEARDVDFSATFTPDGSGGSGGATTLIIGAETRHSAADGPVEGHFELPAGCEAGVLRLEWSNAYSFLRSKSFSCRLVLPGGAAAPKAVIS
jgi:hypothetical protein